MATPIQRGRRPQEMDDALMALDPADPAIADEPAEPDELARFGFKADEINDAVEFDGWSQEGR